MFGVTLHQNFERWVMYMRLMDIVEDLLVEFEHFENMLEILEIGLRIVQTVTINVRLQVFTL